MSMGNSTNKKSGGSHAASITPNPDGHSFRLVLADAITRADSVNSTNTRRTASAIRYIEKRTLVSMSSVSAQ